MFLLHLSPLTFSSFFFFNDTATTEIYTLSLHDALPISLKLVPERQILHRLDGVHVVFAQDAPPHLERFLQDRQDRKSTRLNSSHLVISYAVFCLKKKNTCLWLTNRQAGHCHYI